MKYEWSCEIMQMSAIKIVLHVAVFVTLVVTDVCGLHLRQIIIPKYKMKGEKAILQCLYELDGDSLYAVKWYKENEEFYRYVPKARPPQVSYVVEGIKVDHQESNNQNVVLKSVNLKTTGLYRCEVSAEAPSFSSAQKEGYLQVIVLPLRGPQITGEKKQYENGDELNLNCTSDKSHPVSTLKWYINENQAPTIFLSNYPSQIHHNGLMSSILGLRMKLTNDHFVDGNLRVRCVATFSSQQWQSNKESILQKIDNREAMLLVRSIATSYTPTTLSVSLWVMMTLFSNTR